MLNVVRGRPQYVKVKLRSALALTVVAYLAIYANVQTVAAAGAAPLQDNNLVAEGSWQVSPTDDIIVSGRGDDSGYQVFAADARRSTAWEPLALLRPTIGTEDGWIGRQCITGDGDHVVVTVAPRAAAANPELMAHGGFAYSIDVVTRAVTPLVSGVTLSYFSPTCSRSNQVALTSFATADDAPTTILVVDAATAQVTATLRDPAEVTSAVPLGPTSVLAVRGSTLVRAAADGSREIVATLPGQAFDLRPNVLGGADMLVAELSSGTASVARWDGSRGVTTVGRGPLTGTDLVGGRGGETAVLGGQSDPAADSTGLRWLASPGTDKVEAISLDLDASLTAQAGTSTLRLQRPSGGTVELTVSADGGGRSVTVIPPSVGPPVGSPASSTTTSAPNQSAPTCAVPRNDVHHQIVQPNWQQIDWAAQMTTRNLLTGPRAGDPTWEVSAYHPSSDFPVAGVTVPREVLSGIMATESNWNQASWHAIPGVPGNPLVANYYGSSTTGSTTTWDYSNADCGYGLTQQTDGMHVGDTLFSANVQQAVGLDYVENAAAGNWTLSRKWNQLAGFGITANNGDPSLLENWYFAIWAYNSGVHPDDGTGASGLGWSNNPINPAYPPNRAPYRRVTTADSSHPANWPYQEQVIGWMETPLVDGSGYTEYRAAAHLLSLPPYDRFCTARDFCTSSVSQSPCERADSHCWWAWPASWGSGCTQSECTSGFWTLATTASEPSAPNNPYPPVCNMTSGGNPSSSAVIVDEEADGNPNDLHVRLNSGCSSSLNWQNSGSFSLAFGNSAMIDFHQLGVGFDGHIWFTHEVAQSDAANTVTATWTPNLPSDGAYAIWAFVPSDGATATDATYQINDGTGNQIVAQPVNQNAVSNVWVPIGQYLLHRGATLQLSNNTTASLDDLAFNAVAFDPVASSTSGYVAMGDSYSSGEGAPPYDPVSTADKCDRSTASYPAILATQLSTTYQHNAVYVMCSGAQTKDLAVPGFDGENAQDAWLTPSTQLVTLTIGGNDVGFGPILQSCFFGDGCGSTGYPLLPAQIQAMQTTLRTTYLNIVHDAPNARVAVLTYPQIFPADPHTCNTPLVGHISDSDMQWIETNWSAFNSVIKQAATTVPGVVVVDEEQAFAGHDVCATTPWVNAAIVFGPRTASFHPNSAGDQKLASDLEGVLRL